MILVVFMCVWVTGLGLLRALSAPSERFGPLDVCLGWGLGAGFLALVTLLSFILFGAAAPQALTAFFYVIAWAAACDVWRNRAGLSGAFWLAAGASAVLTLCLWPLASAVPYGGYDAWSLWNYRALALVREPDHWMVPFANTVQGAHPWVLSLFVAGQWLIGGTQTVAVPVLTAAVMTVMTAVLLIAALWRNTGRWPALCAGLFLCSIPFFVWHGVSQYASIWVACYLLAAVVCLQRAAEGEDRYVVLSGVFLGLLALTKDDGLVLAVCLYLAAGGLRQYQRVFRTRRFWSGCVAVLCGLGVMEFLMRAPLGLPRPENSWNLLIDPRLAMEPERWRVIAEYFVQQIIGRAEFGRMWLWLPLVMVALFRPAVRIFLLALAGYFAVFFMLYAMAVSPLEWRLTVTANRLVFQVVPLLVYIIFYSIFVRSDR